MTAGRGSRPLIVGLISDTHSLLRPEVFTAFAGVELIVHAGDVGAPAVLEGLRRIAPVEAVRGNTDDEHDPMLVAERTLPVGTLQLHVSHGHELGRPTPDLILRRYAGDLLVFGHTHRPLIVRDGGRLVVNPGAAGPRRFDLRPTVARLTIGDMRGDVAVEIIELGH